MSYDVDAVRARYPALADGWAYLDGAAGTQVPTAVIEAESAAYAAGIGNHGGYFAASARSDAHSRAAREAVVDLVGAPSVDGVALGPSMTALTYRFADGLSRTWRAGDEVVVTRLDHDANVRPWVQAAARAGATVRWAVPTLPEVELPVEAVTEHLTDRTRLVAVTGASNVIGTRPDVRAITDAAHAVGALVYVDGVHATPHTPVDVAALGADLYATSAYKWSGPHLAAVVGDPGLLETVRPDKLASSSDAVPDRFEYGTSPFAQHAGLAAAVDHLAGLADVAGLSAGLPRTARAAPRVDGGRRGPRGRAAAPARRRPRRDGPRRAPRLAGEAGPDGLVPGARHEPGRRRAALREGRGQRVVRAQLRVGARRPARHPRQRVRRPRQPVVLLVHRGRRPAARRRRRPGLIRLG